MFAFYLESFPYLQRLGHKSLDGATAKATIGRFWFNFCPWVYAISNALSHIYNGNKVLKCIWVKCRAYLLHTSPYCIELYVAYISVDLFF